MGLRSVPWAAGLGLALAILLAPPRARACGSVGLVDHQVDPALLASDHTPPTLSSQPGVTVSRGQGPRMDGCGQSASSCDGVGSLAIDVQASDDLTPSDAIGYRLSLVAGKTPASLILPAHPIRAQVAGRIILVWDDGATDDQEGLDFTLGVAPVDAAGNQGLATSVRVQDPGHFAGCHIARHAGTSAFPALAAPALWLIAATLRRRRRARPLTS